MSKLDEMARIGQSRMAIEAADSALDKLRAVMVHLNLADRLLPASIVDRWVREIEQEKSRW